MDSNESVMNKMQHKYWVTKQAVFRKLGRKEDEFIVASDSELDAKLELFNSIQKTTGCLLKVISRYQTNLSTLAVEENEMGSFMKEYGKIDSTRAGKMMVAVGTSLSYTGQQRFILQTPLDRLYQKLETFHRRAIADTLQTVQKMEKTRTEYRAVLNWMKDISQELDPDTYKQMERFKKVQEHVKICKARFDRLKAVCVTKIDVLAASRSNMFSNLLLLYERSFREFTEKCANTFTVISNSFKGYQHYDFCVVRELSDLKPDSSIIPHQDPEKNEETLLELEESAASENNPKSPISQDFDVDNLLSVESQNSDELLSGIFSQSSLLSPSSAQSSSSTVSNNFFLPSQLLSLQTKNASTPQNVENKFDPLPKKFPDSGAVSKQVKTNSWFDVFAELDPLSNPDAVSKSSADQHRNC